jgi:RNA polymerase sigma factor (TIGR02999 family)
VRAPQQNWQNRAHFFRVAAECMRRILIDNARRKQQVRHGGGQQRVSIDETDIIQDFDPERLLQINEALERLAGQDGAKAKVVKLRFFGGLENYVKLPRVPELSWRYCIRR